MREMADALSLDLVDKALVTNQLTITVGYDIDNIKSGYSGEVTTDFYGRSVPKHAHGTTRLSQYSSSTKQILTAVTELYDRIVDDKLLVRRLNIVANNVISVNDVPAESNYEQLDMFTDYESRKAEQAQDAADLEREKKMQAAMLAIKKKYGKNAILKGMNLEEGATAKDRNRQIGGHKA